MLVKPRVSRTSLTFAVSSSGWKGAFVSDVCPLAYLPAYQCVISGQRKAPILHYAQFGISVNNSSVVFRNFSNKSTASAKMGEAKPPLKYIDVGSRSHVFVIS